MIRGSTFIRLHDVEGMTYAQMGAHLKIATKDARAGYNAAKTAVRKAEREKAAKEARRALQAEAREAARAKKESDKAVFEASRVAYVQDRGWVDSAYMDRKLDRF